MKKFIYLVMLVVATSITSCEKIDLNEVSNNAIEDVATSITSETKKFTFTCKGDFTTEYKEIGTRAATQYLNADGKDMTDLWVYDVVDGNIVQTLHQTNTDENFGKPVLNLTFGSHHVYFIASRGNNPNITNQIVSWDKVSDTFYKDYSVDVVKTSNGNRAVTLDRCVSKLKCCITDAVPVGARKFVAIMSQGSNHLSIFTGLGELGNHNPFSVLSASDEGKIITNYSLFTTCPSEEWISNVTLQYLDSNDNPLYTRIIENVSFKMNRETILTGAMVSSNGDFTISLSADWETPINVEF